MTSVEDAGEGNSAQIDLAGIPEEELRRALYKIRVAKGSKWSWKAFVVTTIAFYIVAITLLIAVSKLPDSSGHKLIDDPIFPWIFGLSVISVPITTAIFQIYVMMIQKIILAITLARDGAADASEKASQLQDNLGEDFVTNLVKINFKYIDQYYLQTQRQADRSFSLAMGVSVVGFTIIAIGITLAVFRTDASAVIATGAGVISEFIAAVFFYLYNRTIQSMGSYHRKLVITQNIALALKISEGLPDAQRSGAQVELVKTLSSDVNNLLTMEGAFH